MDFSIIFDNIGIYLTGLKHTILLVSISLAVGLLIAVPLAVSQPISNTIGPGSAFCGLTKLWTSRPRSRKRSSSGVWSPPISR